MVAESDRLRLPQAVWRKSSRSNGGEDACVQIASLDAGLYGVRDSKDADGFVLIMDEAEWVLFIGRIRSGEHDLA